MKKLFTVLLLLLIFNSKVYSQCEFAKYSDAPEELFRKRVNETGMLYGNPYTMFVKGDDFNFDRLADKLINNESKLKASEDRHPLKKIGSSSDMSQAVEFLLNANWMTGQIMHVDGGMSSVR
jgi:hypothetical protein